MSEAMSGVMSGAMSAAELTEQFVELLPARTVLSLFVQSPWHADISGTGTAGAHGDPGTHGGNGQSIGNRPSIGSAAMWLLFGDNGYNQSDPGPGYRDSIGDAFSHHS